MPTETPAAEAPPPPSTVKSAAIPISMAELKTELAGGPTAPAPRPTGPTEAAPRPVDAPGPDSKPSSIRENMDKAMAERAKKAQAEAKSEAKAPEKKVEEKKVEAKPAEVAPEPVVAKDEVPEDQRKVLPHDKPDTAKRIKAILAEREAARQEAAAAKAELEAAKKAPSTPPEELAKLKAEYEATQGEVLRYRRLHEIEKDPEFAAKYREPVKQIEQTIEATFKKYNLGEETLKSIRDAGGFAAWSESGKVYAVAEPDPENPGQTKQVHRSAAQLLHGWLNGGVLNPVDAEGIKASLGRQQLLKSEEKAAIVKAQEDAKGYFENQTKAQREAAEKAQQTNATMAKEYEEFSKKVETETDWLKDREIPADATAEQRKEMEEYNTFNKQLRDGLKKHPTNALEYGQLKLEAAEAHHLRREKGKLEARLAELEADLKKTRASTRTTSKAGSLMTGTKAADTTQTDKLPPTDWKSRLDAKMAASSGSIDE